MAALLKTANSSSSSSACSKCPRHFISCFTPVSTQARALPLSPHLLVLSSHCRVFLLCLSLVDCRQFRKKKGACLLWPLLAATLGRAKVTCDQSGCKEELAERAAEAAGHHAQAGQHATQHHGHSAAIVFHQDAAQGSCGKQTIEAAAE